MTDETSREGRKGDDLIIMPSSSFFKTLHREVSFTSLKLDVIQCIENREFFLQQLQQHAVAMDHEYKNGTSCGGKGSLRAGPLKSQDAKSLLFNIFNSSLCVVESIVLCDHFPFLDNNTNHNTAMYTRIPSESRTFLWKGTNYLLKMFDDTQFACKLSEVMSILLPEKKSLYRNPFLLPLDIDEIATYNPDAMTPSLEPRTTMLSRVPWNFDLKRIQRAASRLLSEERHISYGDERHILHISSKNTNKVDGNAGIMLRIPSPPEVDVLELNMVIENSTQLHDLVVIYCVKLLIGDYDSDDVSCLCESLHIATRKNIIQLVRKPLNGMVQKLTVMRQHETLQQIETQILLSVYTMVGKYLLTTESIVSSKLEPNESIHSLKRWIIGTVAKESQNQSEKSLKVSGNQIRKKLSNLITIEQDQDNMGMRTLDETKLLKNSLIDKIEKVNSDRKGSVHDHDLTDGEKMVPTPLRALVNAREGCNLLLVEGKIEGISPGNIMRIGHPHYSHDYPVSKIEESSEVQSIFLGKLFNNSAQVDVTSSLDIRKMSSEKRDNVDGTIPPSFEALRAWKLVPQSEDRRLGWRIQYDDGQVPWHHLYSDSSEYEIHFGVQLNLKDVEKQCYDSITDPDTCAYQQRLHYFEKVSLLDIIVETYKCVCQWHPVTSSIDNVKWAKLARKMKFLSSIKNSNHEVDMTFFRHSKHRKLDLDQFKIVLEDMARLKYPTRKFGRNEALANMLWSTVSMLPQVNQMVWTKAQEMAIRVELVRSSAQIRLASLFRKIKQQLEYMSMRSAATCISKNVRCMIMYRWRKEVLRMKKEDERRRFQIRKATLCQRTWRGYVIAKEYVLRKRLNMEKKEKELFMYWRLLRKKGLERKKYLVFKQLVNVQSILTIMSIKLQHNVGTNIEVHILVYIQETGRTFSFRLVDNEIRESLEKILIRKGPLSWNEMLKPVILSQLQSRLIAKTVGGIPFIIFCKRDIAEKGYLIMKKFVLLEQRSFLATMYRSPFDIAIRLYEPSTCTQLRTIIDFSLLKEWLIEDEQERRRETLGVLKFCQFVKDKNSSPNCRSQEKITFTPEEELTNVPMLIRTGHQQGLIKWLMMRIEVRKDDDGYSRLILQYEAEAENMEKVARKFQSTWRSKCAKRKAKRKVHLQYEKHFDMTSKRFFYVHLPSGVRQWSKPSILSQGEDIKDPPDEWRTVISNGPEPGSSSTYFFNPFTGQTSWLSEEDAAKKVQRRFRVRQTNDLLGSNFDFAHIAKVIKFTQDVKTKFEASPEKLSNRVNYALLCHCLHFDIDRARSIYKDAIVKSPCHPVIARAYGLFILSSGESPKTQIFEKACRYFREAKSVDPELKKFQSTIESYFHWAVLMHPNDPRALLNYALLHQCVLGEYYRAEKIYRHAISQHSSDRNVIENYQLFEDQRYPGGFYSETGVPYSITSRSNEKEMNREWGEWIIMEDPLSQRECFKIFWYNKLNKTSRFEEPDWKDVWKTRVDRSKLLSASRKSMWVVYRDEHLGYEFMHNRSTDEYVWKGGNM